AGSVAQPPVQQTAPPAAVAQVPATNSAVNKAVVIPQAASATLRTPSTLEMFQMPFSSSIKTPTVDIVSLKNNITMIFAGILLGIFVVDLYVAFRRKTVRAVGSSFAHMFFLAAMFVSMNNVLHGAIL